MTQQLKEMNMNINLSPNLQFSKDDRIFKMEISIQLYNFNKMQSFIRININTKKPTEQMPK
jgi:hypothetical protein